MEVFARILSRLEAPLLQRHCSAVLDEELRHVHAELNEILAAYARLQEVREAVASLEAGSSDVRRSDSMMETAEATAQLQLELTVRMEFVESTLRSRAAIAPTSDSAESALQPAETKRKRHEDNAPAVEDKEFDEKPQKKVKELQMVKCESHETQSSTDASESSSETESENETLPTAPGSPVQTAPSDWAAWEAQVHNAGRIAQRLFSAKVAPAFGELRHLVDALELVLGNTPACIGDFRAVARGQFNNLVCLTVRVFQSGQRNQSLVPLAETTLRALHDAMAIDAALEGLRKFYDELEQIKHKMESYKITTSYTEPTALDPLPTPWEARITAVTAVVQSMLDDKGRPKIKHVTHFVESLSSILKNVEISPGAKFQRLANGQFDQLLKLTVRLLTKLSTDPQFLEAAQTAVRSLERASPRDPVLHGLWPYQDKLYAVVRKMQERGGANTATPQPAFHAAKWMRGVDELSSYLGELKASRDAITFANFGWVVNCFCEMLSKAANAPVADSKLFTSQKFHTVIMETTRLFNRPEAQEDTKYLSLLDQALAVSERVSTSQARFQMLGVCVQDLRKRRTRLGTVKRSTPSQSISSVTTTTERTTSTDAMAIRFDALVSVADELLAVPISERSGRVSNYAFSLLKELKACFPIKGRRTTPSRGTLSAAADAIQKAVELVQDEPHAARNESLYKQFLELLYAIGAKYTTIKLLISRSRDDLYLYLYPDSNPPSAKHAKPKKTSAAEPAGATTVTDEAALLEQLLTVFARVQSWHHDVFSLKEFDDVMRVVRTVMGHTSKTWRVRRDRTVAECLELLAVRALAIKKKEHRDGRLSSVSQWQQQMERQR